jgi:hypothetical protein
MASLLVYFAELVPQVQLGPQRQTVQLQFDLSLFVSFFVFMIFVFVVIESLTTQNYYRVAAGVLCY